VEPFVVWVEKQLARSTGEGVEIDQDSIRAADVLRNMIARTGLELTTEAFRGRVVEILKSSPQLPVSWWLSKPLTYREGENDREIWPAEFNGEVTQRAIAALKNDETLPSIVVQASMILANSTDQTAEQQKEIAEALNRRLQSLAKDRSALTLMVQTPDSFMNFSVPATDSGSPLSRLPLQIEVRRSYVREIPVLENSLALSLLNHAWKLDKGASVRPQIEVLFRTLEETFARLQTQALAVSASKDKSPSRVSIDGRSPRPPLHLLWPELRTEDNGAQGFNSSRPVNLNQHATATLWGKYEPTKQDWLEYLILLHPVMTERVTEAVKVFEPTPATEAAPAEKTE
jgi:hypothetical protein